MQGLENDSGWRGKESQSQSQRRGSASAVWEYQRQRLEIAANNNSSRNYQHHSRRVGVELGHKLNDSYNVNNNVNNNNNSNSNSNSNSNRYNNRGKEMEMRELEDMLSNLNPFAREFVPPSLIFPHHNIHSIPSISHVQYHHHHNQHNVQFVPNSSFPINDTPYAYAHTNADATPYHCTARQKRNIRGRSNPRTSVAQREEVIRRTVYVSDIDLQVTEEQLAALFINCGQVVDCRICGDPNSVLRFAFLEFTDKEGAQAALALSGTILGFYPVKVQPSKTAIAPVNPYLLPHNEDEREKCARTIYCTNIDKKVSQAELKLFFQSVCGEVRRSRMLGDYHHNTRIAFVEFVMAESATAALSCSGVVLGSSPIRVSPSKTPVRPRAHKQPTH